MNSEQGAFPIDIKGLNSDDSTDNNKHLKTNIVPNITIEKRTMKSISVPEIIRIDTDENTKRSNDISKTTSKTTNRSSKKSKKLVAQNMPQLLLYKVRSESQNDQMDTTIESDEDMKLDTNKPNFTPEIFTKIEMRNMVSKKTQCSFASRTQHSTIYSEDGRSSQEKNSNRNKHHEWRYDVKEANLTKKVTNSRGCKLKT